MQATVAATTLLTFKVGLVAVLLILVPGVTLGYVLARYSFRGRSVVQTVVALPMVLPPVAVGLLLLLVLSPNHPFGALARRVFGGQLLLTWWAAAIAAAVMSFPLLVRGAEQGFRGVPRRLELVARTLGASRVRVFVRVTLPLAARGIAYGAGFAFARGLGEFGATMLVAGSIPGETETLAQGIYSRIDAFDHAGAIRLSLVSIAIAFAITLLAEAVLRRRDA